MKLTTAEKIKLILGRKNMTLSDLAEGMGTSRQNLHNKMNRNNFSENELRHISEVLGIELSIEFVTEDGDRI